ncbi:MAG: 50S ribosomal protein L19 [Chloroflexi bacterium]|nr:50S ribosomal protein L19 [Chloroflexota bacterium]
MDAAAVLAPAKVRNSIQEFRPGDNVRVNVTIREGDRTRVQAYQGIVIKGSYQKDNPPAPGATFTVRRVSYGVGVERTFLLCSPMLDSLENTRRGKVAQGRLYYLRGLTGRKARIKEKRVPGVVVAEEGQEAVPEVAEPAAEPGMEPVTEVQAGAEPQPSPEGQQPSAEASAAPDAESKPAESKPAAEPPTTPASS